MLASEIIKKIRRIEIRTRRIVDQITGGAYKSVFKGQGMEFDEVREYQEGDDVRSIDWNVSARMGHPFIKKFVEEREMTVFLLVDVSASGFFGSNGKSKLETIAELSALLAFSAIRNQDQVGLLLFSDQDELFIPPKKGKSHVLRLIRELLAHKSQNKGTDIGRALKQLNRVQKKKAVVFLISDMIDKKDFSKELKISSKRHDLIGIHVSDQREQKISKSGIINFEDSESGTITFANTISSKFRSVYQNISTKRSDINDKLFKDSGVDLIKITNGEDYIKPLMSFFKKREKKKSK